MMLFRCICGALAALLLSSSMALAQGASFAAGTLWGNDTAAARPGKVVTATAILDRAFGSSRGSILMRGASGWQLLSPGTTGRALISAGAGADLAFSVLGIVGGGTNCSVASGTCLDNITGFSSTSGYMRRAGAGSYVFDFPSFAQITGSVACSQLPAWIGDVTTSAGSCTTALANIPNDTVMAGDLLATNIVAPATPAAGKIRIYADSTAKNLQMKNDLGSVTTMVLPLTCSSNNWLNALGSTGQLGCTQPNFTNLAGSVAASQMPALTGDCTTSAGAVSTTCTKTNGVAFSSGATSGIVAVKIQTFCPSGCTTTISAGSDGTYTPSAGMVYAVAELCGGGGGGGGTASPAATTGSGGAGGGAGAYALKVLTAAAVGASKNVRIGAAGTAGTAGNNAGGNGGKTCIGTGAACVTTTLTDANGGTAGGGSSGAGAPTPGAGGTAGTGDTVASGQPGGGFPAITGAQGYGGPGGSPAMLGGGSVATMTATTATGSTGPSCAGGGGGAAFNTGAAAAGGPAGGGYVRMKEFTTQ